MFTTWCTLYAKLVPAGGPGIPLFRDYVNAKNSTMVESASKHKLKVISWLEET